MLKTTRLYGLSNKPVDSDTFRVDYADDLDLLILKTRIGLRKTRKNRNSQAAKEWRERAVRFINSNNKCTTRLVRVFGKYFLEEMFGSQVTISMLRPPRFHRIRLARLKKTGGKD